MDNENGKKMVKKMMLTMIALPTKNQRSMGIILQDIVMVTVVMMKERTMAKMTATIKPLLQITLLPSLIVLTVLNFLICLIL